MLNIPLLAGPAAEIRRPWRIVRADDLQREAYLRLRRDIFVHEQGIFTDSDHDDHDDDPRTVVIAAVDNEGALLGGVRITPHCPGTDIGWWRGDRLVVRKTARSRSGIGTALVRRACATAEKLGALRFDATVQSVNEKLFLKLGWEATGHGLYHGVPHVSMQWPIHRPRNLIAATKQPLGPLLDVFHGSAALGGPGYVGDDGSPVPGSDLVAACDSILPAMVENDPRWAGWCSVLVNLNDLSAMGATPVGVLDAVAGYDARTIDLVLQGMSEAAQAWDIPVLGGHTQLGVASALTVTALGRTSKPVPGSGGHPGQEITLTADLAGQWRPGFEGKQWDSTSTRSGHELRAQGKLVADARPDAAKDVSMAGIIGTAGMLAESSGTGVTLDIASIPRPEGTSAGDWLTCFPGFAMLTADDPGQSRMSSPTTESKKIGRLTDDLGLRLRWPDGVETNVASEVTGLGSA